MIIFAEKNKELREMFKKEFPDVEVVEDMFSVPEPKIVTTCSNPWFSMGGGLDAIIKQKYPDECRYVVELNKSHTMMTGSYERIGRVLFTVTVGEDLKADKDGISCILEYINTRRFSNEVYVFTGMGTGIGGMDNETFIRLFKEVYA